MKFVGRTLEVLLSFAFLWIIAAILWPPDSYFNPATTSLDESNPLAAVVHAGLLVFLVAVTLARPQRMLHLLRCALPILLLVALAYLSAFWSVAPDLVLRRATTLAATTLFAIYLVDRFDIARLVSMLVKLNAIAALASFLIMVIAPKLGLSGNAEYPDAWRGVYTAKNTLGGMSAFGLLLAIYAFYRGYGSRLISGAVIPLNFLLLYLSESGTSLAALIAAGYAAMVAAALRRRSGAGLATGVALLVAGLAAVGFMVLAWDQVLVALSRSPSLTGRLGLWQMALEFIDRRPWLGYGYGAFWRRNSVDVRTMWDYFAWQVPHVHNALLEIGLALGIVGMGGAIAVWLVAFYRCVRVLTLPSVHHVVFCTALLTGILVVNATEYEFLRPDAFLWLLFVAAFVYLGREALAYRAERAALRQAPRRVPVGALPSPRP